MVDAVVAAGVRRIVYTSFVGAAPDCTFTFGRDHFHTEEHIKATGVGAHVPARQPLPRLHPRAELARRRDPRAGRRRARRRGRARRHRRRRRAGPHRRGPRRAGVRPHRRGGVHPCRGGGGAVARVGPADHVRGRDARGGARVPAPERRGRLRDRGLGDVLRRHRRGRPRRGQRLRAALPRPPAEAARPSGCARTPRATAASCTRRRSGPRACRRRRAHGRWGLSLRRRGDGPRRALAEARTGAGTRG